jgi:peroxiredoxin Q/BCP
MWTILLIVCLVLAGGFAATRMLSSRSMPAAGSPATDFSLPSQQGTPVRLSDYRGQWVALYFYPKDMTSGCTLEARNFQRDQGEFAKRNAVVLGVSVDSAESHRRFCEKEGLRFKLLADTSGQVSKQYGSLINLGITKVSARNTFLIDPQGNIARGFAGVNPNHHSAEVLQALDELQQSSK